MSRFTFTDPTGRILVEVREVEGADHELLEEGKVLCCGPYLELRRLANAVLDAREYRRPRAATPAPAPQLPKPWYSDPRATWGT